MQMVSYASALKGLMYDLMAAHDLQEFQMPVCNVDHGGPALSSRKSSGLASGLPAHCDESSNFH
jgi:hypothetical protein